MERLIGYTLNTATLIVEADASGAKASTKHLESCLEVIQGHALSHCGIIEKPTRDCVPTV